MVARISNAPVASAEPHTKSWFVLLREKSSKTYKAAQHQLSKTIEGRSEKRVRFQVDKGKKAPRKNIVTYEAPYGKEKALVYMSAAELAESFCDCRLLVRELRQNKAYAKTVARIRNQAPQLVAADDDGSLSLDSSFSFPDSSFSSLGFELEEDEIMGDMRGLESFVFADLKSQNKINRREIVALQNHLTALRDPERKANLVCETSIQYSQKSAIMARKMAQWDAQEAAKGQ